MKEDFLQKIDGNLESMGFSDRAAFIRKAVAEKLKTYRIEVTASEMTPPSRAGKGGRPPKDLSMNDAPATDVVPETREAGNYPVKKRTNRKKKS